MKTEYGFINAVARTKRGVLLKKPFFDHAANQADIFGVVNALEQTVYRPYISSAMMKDATADSLDEALRRQLAACLNSLLNKARSEPRELIEVLLSRYDIENIKIILRALHNKISAEEVVRSLMPAGSIKKEVLFELANEIDVRTCIETMGRHSIEYFEPLRKGLENYLELGSIAALEIELERFGFKKNLEKTRTGSQSKLMVHNYLLQEADFLNLMVLMRIVHEGVDIDDPGHYYIDRGKEISKKRFLDLIKSESVADLCHKLAGTTFEPAIMNVLPAYESSRNLSVIERQLEQLVSRRRIKMFLANPLSIASVLAYMAAKDLEICNLRILIEGVSANAGEAQIKEELYIV